MLGIMSDQFPRGMTGREESGTSSTDFVGEYCQVYEHSRVYQQSICKASNIYFKVCSGK